MILISSSSYQLHFKMIELHLHYMHSIAILNTVRIKIFVASGTILNTCFCDNPCILVSLSDLQGHD